MRFTKVIILLLFLYPLLFTLPALAQSNSNKSPDGLSWDFDENSTHGFSIGKFLSDAFTPQIIVDTRRIREYVRDERFLVLRNQCGDMRSIDAIYLKALKIADFNIARALFLSLMAVLEHRNVELKMPIIKSLAIPLSFEEDSIFNARMKNLPTHVYPDTPRGTDGDRDKLQHLFASAYLVYVSEAPELTRATGNLIEWGEAKFVVGGSEDPRDKRANNFGESFGRDLLVVKTLLPSDYLTLPYEDRK